MRTFIDSITIRNFKSIRECEIESCARINLFIGRPNVGKSNLLEALSLFSIPFLKENTSKKLSNLVRVEAEAELFYRGNFEEEAEIATDLGTCHVRYEPKDALRIFLNAFGETYMAKVDDKLSVRALSTKDFSSRIMRYDFKKDIFYRKGHAKYLIPPFGFNLLSIIDSHPELKAQVTDLFRESGLKILSDKTSYTIKIEHRNADEVFLVPYNSIADTLQRLIFYKSAVASNEHRVLLFEEPEAHSFPPFMTELTQDMIERTDNQFFIATHSSFILADLLENGREDLAVFIVYFENGETKLRRLEQEELHEAYQKGVDFFTNSESFV